MLTRHATLCAVFAAAVLFPRAVLPAEAPPEAPPEVPPVLLGTDPLGEAFDIVGRGATPLFAVANLAIHEVSLASLPAHISFSLDGDRPHTIMVSFDARERDPSDLRREADRVLKHLRVLYGPPAWVTRTPGEYKTHVWSVGRRSLVHTVVFTSGVERHFIEADGGVSDE